MSTTILRASAIFGIASILAAIICGIFASRESVSLRKGRLKLAATLLFGFSFLVFGVTSLLWLRSLPTLNAEGVISSADVHPQGRGYVTNFNVRRADGATFHLDADGRSDYFRQGEHVVLTYRGYTGSVILVHFIKPSGAEEAVFQSTEGFQPYLGLLVGCFLCGAGYIVYRRDPEGARKR
jgi:hypothetical protein